MKGGAARFDRAGDRRAARSIVAATRNVAGRALAGVEVRSVEPRAALLGSTDARGSLEVPWPEPGRIAFRHPGYVTAFRAVQQPAPGELVVRLEPGGSLNGRVVASDGSPPPEGVRVCALPSDDASPGGTRDRAGPRSS